MAQVTKTVARGILAGQGYTDNEVRQLAHHWLASHEQAPAQAAPAAVAGPVAYRVLRKRHDGEWVTDGRAWCDGVPTQDLVDDIALRSDGWRIEYAFAAPAIGAPVAQPAILGPEHKGMRVDYSGLFKQARGALARGIKEPALAEMLRQFQGHMQELGQRWYAGDTAVIDELLQLYCIEQGARAQAKEGQSHE